MGSIYVEPYSRELSLKAEADRLLVMIPSKGLEIEFPTTEEKGESSDSLFFTWSLFPLDRKTNMNRNAMLFLDSYDSYVGFPFRV